MCGIAGIQTSGNYKTVSETCLDKLIAPIIHRGPDGFGKWIHEGKHLGFAHRRLSIIDLSQEGNQPFHREDLKLSITFNGEIYNYIELRESLTKKGNIFYTATDTEVILVAFKEYGYNCLNYFDGMFAFGLWDQNKRELFCARDRFGEKPFHYYLDENQFVFASEIKQFWSFGLEKKISQTKLSGFINHSEILDDKDLGSTFYSNIRSLKASHYLICSPDLKIITKNYWNLNNAKSDSKISFADSVTRFTELFNNSVQKRLRSDVALGSSLSGGLDSSSIVYTVNKLFLKPGQQQFTFSARFKNYEKDEGKYIDILSDQLKNVIRFDVFLDAEEFEKDIETIIYHQDEPFQSASIFAQYKVMQLAKKNDVTVLLDGQGADELLGGYENFYVDYLKQLFYNNTTLYTKEVRAYNNLHAFKYGEVDLYKNDKASFRLKRNIKRIMNRKQAVPADHFLSVLKNYITGSQLQQLLRYADRNSMAHSVETRLPFLNHELVEFVFTLPDHFKLNEGWPKYILRKSFENKIPKEIVWRKNKVGFETPETNFLQTEKATLKLNYAKQYVNDHHLHNSTDSINPWLLYMLSSYIAN